MRAAFSGTKTGSVLTLIFERSTTMRKLLLTTVLVAGLPVIAHANDWFVLNPSQANCLPLDGGADVGGWTSPGDAVTTLRSEGEIPQAQITRDDSGQILSVYLGYMGQTGAGEHMQFFTTTEGCQTELANELKSGEITDPNLLK